MERRLYLEGGFEFASSSVEVRSPWDGRLVSKAPQASMAQLDRALGCARDGRRRLQASSAGERRAVLDGIVRGLKERAEELAGVITAESGKPIALARLEVSRAVETFTLASAELSRFGGSVVPVDLLPGGKGAQAVVRRVPAGVVVGIVPFNFPLNLGAHKIAPALAVGAPIIVKPPPQAPSALLLLAEVAKAAGADPAALQVLTCGNAEAEALATDPRVAVVSFTGSARVGWHLKSKVPGRVVLELGGNAAAIVCADADLPLAARRLGVSAVASAGQVCIKVQRIVVEAKAFEPFLKLLLAELDAIATGDPALEATLVGPVIDDAAADRIEAWIAEAVELGAKVWRRGARVGRLLGPTVLSQVPRTAKACAEEIFGPVVVVEQVDSFSQALEVANDSRYGLQASVFTHDLRLVRRAFDELEVGGVIVNDAPSFRSDAMPYGGVKASGLSREGVACAMEDFSEPRVLVDRTP